MRNIFPSECNGGEAKSGNTLKVCSTDIQDEPMEMELVYGFVEKESHRWVYLPPGKKVKTLCRGSHTTRRDSYVKHFSFVEGDILLAVDYPSHPNPRPGDIRKETEDDVFSIDGLEGIEVIVL